MITVKVGDILINIDENVAKQYYPHLAQPQQDNKEMQKTSQQTLSSDTGTGDSQEILDTSVQTSPRKTRRKASPDTEASNEGQ